MTDLDSRVACLRARQLDLWESGERVLLEQLFADHPGLRDDPSALLDLIYAEVLLREEFGDHPDADEYVRRFPSCETAIRRQFAFHAAFGALGDRPTETESILGMTTAAQPSAERGDRPDSIGPYEILEEIGRGGMGVVYRGVHRSLMRTAAIKQLRSGAGEEERERFLTEARAVAALKHPNIVCILEVSDPQMSDPYVALEFAEGGNLGERINATPLPPREAAALLVPLAEAIEHAHSRGILHRDLKPSNVLLAAGQASQPDSFKAVRQESLTYTPRVTDFGLAKQLDADSSKTRTGAILGTPSYMAPEQATGRNDEVGPATDVYGLGAILYEMLTGRPPFRADTVINTLNQVIDEEPVPPRSLQRGVPRDLETVCLKCLHKTPGRRYDSAAELAADVKRFLNGEPIRARPAGATERVVKWVRRRPATALLIGGGVVALAALLCVWVLFTLQLEKSKRDALDQRDEARKQELIAQRERTEAQNQSNRARHLLALSATAVDSIAVNVRNAKAEEKASGNTGTVLFKLACFYAKTSKTLGDDPDLGQEDRSRLADQYAASAVRLLNCAEQVGFFSSDKPANRRALKSEADLEPLRVRADYKKFVERLQ